jgi:hypothetical protein
VYKNQLYEKYMCALQEGNGDSNIDIEEAIAITKHALRKFRKEQEVCEIEHSNRVNDAGYFGELRMIIMLLDALRFCPLGRDKTQLHLFLTNKTFFPPDMPQLKPESVSFVKELESRSEIIIIQVFS